ncbi:hypothetical protein OQA88_4309 [Cercophora sp. LCS_1]
MAETTTITLAPAASDIAINELEPIALAAEPTSSPPPASPPRPKPPATIYLPAPIRTYPLPAFYPNNPISLLHLAYAWLSQTIFPPAAEPSVIHIGIWDPDTRSVHVADPKSIRALWEQGFFGKGSLSRSEPNWLRRELNRRNAIGDSVSEQRTEARREARRVAKWERAKAEIEAVEQQRLEEAGIPANTASEPELAPAPALADEVPGGAMVLVQELKAPVGPAELLALPNSASEAPRRQVVQGGTSASPSEPVLNGHVNGRLDNGHTSGSGAAIEEHVPCVADPAVNSPKLNNGVSPAPSVASTVGSGEPATYAKEILPLKRRKSVRFSPTVESTTFQLHDPPSPRRPGSPPKAASPTLNGVATEPSISAPTLQAAAPAVEQAENAGDVVNKEHFQLAPVEAFFLVFSLGALSVVDPVTLAPIQPKDLLTLFRAHSYFPPLDVGSPLAHLQPQNPFLVEYAVYHHFRSLGWVVRHGIKFGVDFLLYERGPVASHSDFGAIIVPSFTDKRWKEGEYEPPKRTWSWLMGINRVLAHVLKSLVLIYVDIPPPSVFEEALQKGGIAAALKKYTIREVMVRRFSVNRNR